jgi:GDP-4-dehydro-6-deoxy-D-mannose reductase
MTENPSEHTAQPTILVTGGTGFAGTHLIEALLAKGYANIHATHFGQAAQTFSDSAQVHFHQLDLTDRNATISLFQTLRPTQIYHLASFAAVGKSFEQAEPLLKNNTILQLNVLEAIRQHTPAARLLSIGSAEEYGTVAVQHELDEQTPFNPVNPYAVSKVTQEMLSLAYLTSYQLQIVRARPFNHIGEKQSPEFVIPAFVSQIVKIERGEQDVLKVGNLSAVRDFTDVKDMVQAYITLMENGQVGQVYNIGTGKGWQISEVLEKLLVLSTTKITVEQDPTRMRPSDVPYFVANNSRIKQLGWNPTIPIEETLQRILLDWRQR